MAIEKDEEVVTAKDVMSKPVVTLSGNESSAKAAQLMEKKGIGGIIVVNESGKPIGIVTERDLALRVVAKNLQPSKVKVSDVMSRPLVTIDGDVSIREVAKKMSKLEIRRLVVIHGGKLQGIITSKDILRITPAMMDVLSEKSRLSPVGPVREASRLAGYCDKCGVWSDSLAQHDGQFYCQDCLSDV